MTVSISGLTFAVGADGLIPNAGYVRFTGTGTYTAADFTITADDGLGFTPTKVLVRNLTDRTETLAYLDAAFIAGTRAVATDEGLKTVADGTRTYADHGVANPAERELTIDVSVAGPITDNDDFVIECWA